MGYQRKPSVFNIKFADDHEFAGLEMKMRPVNIDFYRKFVQTACKLSEFKDTATSDDLDAQVAALDSIAEVLDEMRQLFASKLISWNMEEDGNPFPADIEGVRLLEDKEFQILTSEWLEGVGGVSEGLGKDSGFGETNLGLSDLMEPLSTSQAS